MKILVINAGSSSLKFQLIKTGKEYQTLAKGIIDGLGLKHCRFTFKSSEKNIGIRKEVKTHLKALKLVLDTLVKERVIEKLTNIDAIGHRVVHGGEKYSKPTKIDAKVIKEIKKLSPLAPLHNPINLEVIKGCKKILPQTPQVAIFDTAFHQSMSETAYIYGIPYKMYQKYHIRKYGFHGTSHKFVIGEALKILKKKKAKIISCHLGNGSSITAFYGKVIDTSMGFSPLAGVMMGTRSGSIDPSIIFHMEHNLKMSDKEIEETLNNKSGLKGISGVSSDMRKIYQASRDGNKLAKLSIELLAYQIAKFCGAYAASLNGLEALVFTGGIGENAFYLRDKVCHHLKFLGVELDNKKNHANEKKISTTKSKVKVFVIPTNEEIQIAKETEKLLK